MNHWRTIKQQEKLKAVIVLAFLIVIVVWSLVFLTGQTERDIQIRDEFYQKVCDAYPNEDFTVSRYEWLRCREGRPIVVVG